MQIQTAARATGTLFITATVAGVSSLPFAASIEDAGTSASSPATAVGLLLVLTMAIAIALIPVAAFPILRQQHEVAGLGYVVCRTLEAVAVVAAPFVGWGPSIAVIVFCTGALLLNTTLLRSRLVPRVISVWGLAGAALHLAGGVALLFGGIGSWAVLLAAPIALNEMVLAVWLIARGVTTSHERKQPWSTHRKLVASPR